MAVAYWRDGGRYPRISGIKREGDPYLRAATVMVASLRRFAPDVAVEIHTNVDDDQMEHLARLGARVTATPFEHRMPDGYFHKFTASTYSIDVVAALAETTPEDGVAVLVDPDVVWLRDPGELLDRVAAAGLLTYPIPYPADFVDLGLTRRRLSEVAAAMTGVRPTGQNGLIDHLGGEFLGGDRVQLGRFAAECSRLWDLSLARFEAAEAPWLHTEEHVFSAAFSSLSYGADNTTDAIRRVWTRPGRLRNVRSDDAGKVAWHALSEKGRGLDALFDDHVARSGAFEADISDDEFRRRVARRLSVVPTIRDVVSFRASRLNARVRGRRCVPMPA